jgi:HEAT repeat protein/cyclophilin family peptidyl-prolyl cis-trans isomerase
MLKPRFAATLLIALSALTLPAASQTKQPPALTAGHIAEIAGLVMLEDTRRFDEPVLARLAKSPHPEVRRRAIVAVGRIFDPRADPRGGAASRAILAEARADKNPEIVATVAFAAGQIKDADSVSWLGTLLSAPATPAAVAREAACSLGKIRTPSARAALVKYLSEANVTTSPAGVAGEALLALGRFGPPADLSALSRWAASANPDVRWRTAWALFRTRDSAAVTPLLALAADKSPEVRFWAVRGFAIPAPPGPPRAGGPAAPPTSDWSGVDRAKLAAVLRTAASDSDRRVRTEALRALATHDDDASFAMVLAALDSPDNWLAASAAELIGRFTARKDAVVPALVRATAPSRPTSLRAMALTPLGTFAPEQALDAATALAKSASVAAKNTVVQVLGRLGEPGRARLAALADSDPQIKNLMPGAPRPPRTPAPARTEADYLAIVNRWIVPDYKGAAKPRVILNTVRGEIEIELYPGDAPLGLEYLVDVVTSGEIVGTEFGRLVPNFVAQQRPIREAGTLRDEVNRRGLIRGNLSWASAGLDTGRPGYTLGNTPQPHNEGDFTSLGRVIRGMDAVDRLEFGDKVTGARLRR